jgi:competence protein ComEA
MPSLPNIEDLFYKFRYPILVFLLGVILTAVGLFVAKNGGNTASEEVEVLRGTTEALEASGEIVVEIAGAVEKPGVYKLSKNSRVEDLLIISAGVSSNADRDWMQKSLNRAAKLIDGQKIYIPVVGEQLTGESAKNIGGYNSVLGSQGSGQTGLVNINLAGQKELESLPGIGPVYAQKISEQRPYSNIEELLSKNVLNKSTFEKVKDLVTVY